MATIISSIPAPSLHRLLSLYTRRATLNSFTKSSKITSFSSWSSHKPLSQAMEAATKEMTPLVDEDESTLKEYALQSKLLQEITNVPSIDKAWIFPSDSNNSRAMVSVGQANLLGNKKRSMMLSANVCKGRKEDLEFRWSSFPVEMVGVSAVVPSPSGAKLLVVRNKENDSPTQLEIWSSARVEKEIHVPQSVHGSVYADGWFEGISWNHDESLIAYVAEEPPLSKPTLNDQGFKKEGSSEKDCNSWKCQGDWEEDWGETYAKKRNPSIFVVNVNSGEVRAAEGIPRNLSTGQVVWAPVTSDGSNSLLVFVGWSCDNGPQDTPRKLGIKFCYNRPCALYAVKSPFQGQNFGKLPDNNAEISSSENAVNLTPGLSSSFIPRFSPDGKYLVFVSAKCAVDSGAHSATDSLHSIDWPADGKLHLSSKITDVVPAVMCPEDDCFPGLYYPCFLSYPWLSDGSTAILSSLWGSTEVILSVNIFSSEVLRISPKDAGYSWHILALDGDNILAVCSSPVDPPRLKYGYHSHIAGQPSTWEWVDVASPTLQYFDKIRSLLSSIKCSILKIPVSNPSDGLSKGAQKPFEAIFVEHETSTSENSLPESQQGSSCRPLILILHGGPHTVSISGYTKSWTFLTSLGYNLLVVNYRGSIGFGEEALQSLPGKIGFQDVNDVLAALDYVIEMGRASASKVAVVGGSHGGFLTTHLIGQAPDRFAVAAARNPVCNLSIMLGTTDIPDWCYFEVFGKDGKNKFSEAPSIEDLIIFYKRSPIAHLAKVKTPTLFLLGAQDLRVPVSNGLQYARALRETGNKVKIIVFPEDTHGIERPQSDFESFLNIGVWFKKYL